MNITNAIEKRLIEQKQREYLGVSTLGIQCDRWKWYNFRLATKPLPITAREERLFNRGHIEELVVVNELIKAGAKITGFNADDSIIEMFKNTLNVDIPKVDQERATFCHGHGSGHCDGTIDGDTVLFVSKDEIIFEGKTSNNRGFSALKNSQDLQKSKPEHFSQAQGYMHLFKKKKCFYVMTKKETDERIYLLIKYDKKFCKAMFKKNEEIILMDRPPERISEDRDFYMCSKYTCKITGDEKYFCEHREVCHNDARYQPTCRTCQYVKMYTDAKWKCTKKKKLISFKKQLKGCGKRKSM